MIRTFIDRLTGRAHAGKDATVPGGPDPDALVREDLNRLGAIDPDTRRRWLMLRNTISASTIPAQKGSVPLPSRILRPALVTGIVASAVVMVLLLSKHTPVHDQSYMTGRGQMTAITLADSSDVILNHTSQVIVAAMQEGKARTVNLRGEAFFKVRRNGSPFRVITSAGSVEVLGTEFNVRERTGGFEVAVLSGKVRVSVPRVDGDRLVELTKGMILSVVAGDTACMAQELRFDVYPGWLHNRLVFQDRPLASVCEELEDRFDVRIRITRSGAESERISGTLESRTPENALASLAALTDLSIRHEADAYVLY